MIITSAIIGATAFVVQGLNAWRSRKNAQKLQKLQENCEMAIQKGMHSLAKEQFEILCQAKREIAEEEHNIQVELLNDIHQENLGSIEYLTSLDKWPLAVMPLVMRNDSLFFNAQINETQINQNDIIPISVILGPCRDKAFQKAIWERVEEQLALHFCTYWRTSSSHPIIFYQDAWKDEKDPADGSSYSDIHSKIRYVPTIIISPIVTKTNSLQFEYSHWCIKGVDPIKSYVKETRMFLPEGSFVYERKASYDEKMIPSLVNELCTFIESFVGFMSDQYMWYRYHFAPQMPLLIQKGILSCNNDESNTLYQSYLNMIELSINTGDVFVVSEIDTLLSYCTSTDICFDRTDCFASVLRKISLVPQSKNFTKLINGVPYIPNENLYLALSSYCNENAKFYGIQNFDNIEHNCKIVQKVFQIEEETRKWIKENGSENYPWTKKECKQIVREYVRLVCGGLFPYQFKKICQEVLNNIPDTERNKQFEARFIYIEKVMRYIMFTLTKGVLENKIINYQKECLSEAIKKTIDNLSFIEQKDYDNNTLIESKVMEDLQKEYISTNHIDSLSEYSMTYTQDAVGALAKRTMNYYVDYNYFRPDTIHLNISQEQQNDLDDYIQRSLKEDIIEDLERVIDGLPPVSPSSIRSDDNDLLDFRSHLP